MLEFALCWCHIERISVEDTAPNLTCNTDNFAAYDAFSSLRIMGIWNIQLHNRLSESTRAELPYQQHNSV